MAKVWLQLGNRKQTFTLRISEVSTASITKCNDADIPALTFKIYPSYTFKQVVRKSIQGSYIISWSLNYWIFCQHL